MSFLLIGDRPDRHRPVSGINRAVPICVDPYQACFCVFLLAWVSWVREAHGVPEFVLHYGHYGYEAVVGDREGVDVDTGFANVMARSLRALANRLEAHKITRPVIASVVNDEFDLEGFAISDLL